jgi:DNA-binding NarL/FixJ family response regulator
MRVALAEDGGIVREALVLLLEKIGVDVIFAAPTAGELLTFLLGEQPDAVITDLKMPPTYTDEGVQLARQVKAMHPDTGVLVLSAYNETAQAAQLIEDGKALHRALTRVRTGEVVVDPDVVKRLVSARRHAEDIDRLSSQERKVLASMAEGHTDKEIAELLSLERSTVSDHVGAVFQKLGISPGPGNKRVKAVLKWLRLGN